MMKAFAILAVTAAIASAQNWCDPSGSKTWSDVACPTETSTCCSYHWSLASSGMACCPLPGAVCCSNGYTCCPAGHKCVDSGHGFSVITTCVPNSADEAEVPATDVTGKQICKIGAQYPMSTSLPNVIIAGDSVSIGYTPFVAQFMAAEAFVQHTPWSGDGGWCETQYTLSCLDFFLTSPSGEPVKPDILVFNSGLHNLLTSGSGTPGQSGNTSVYAPQLTEITNRLVSWSKTNDVKLLFLLTSAYLCEVSTDDIVVELNKEASAIMGAAGIPTANLHDAIVGKCGAPPVTECFGVKNCFCPHCPNSDGYPWLANSTIIPAIKKLL